MNQHFNHSNIQTGTHQQPSSTQHCDMLHGDSSEVTDQTSSQRTPHPLQGLPVHHGNHQQLQDTVSSHPNPQFNAEPNQHTPPSDRTLPPPQTLIFPSDGIQTSVQQPQGNSNFSTDSLYTDPYLMSMYRSAVWSNPFLSLAYGPPYPGTYNYSFPSPNLPHVQRMIHPGGLANPHSVAPPVRATSSQSASSLFSETERQLPSQLHLPPPIVNSQAMPSRHLPDYPSVPQWCPQQCFAGLSLLNQFQYSHNPHIWAMQNPVITSSPPSPVQPHYTDLSVYANVDSPAQQSFSNQPTSNQSSANLLTVEPTIPHSASASQPASLSDNSMTDSTESRYSQCNSTPAPKRPCLSSHDTLAPILSEIEQPESCVTSVRTVASKYSQTVGNLSSSNTQRVQHTRPDCSDSNTAVFESFSDSQHTESQVKMDLSGDHTTLPPISAKNFDIVYNTLYSVRSKWYEFGLALGILTDTLDSIAADENHKTEGCLRRMLCKRIEMKHLTWCKVAVALRRPSVNRIDLAEKIEKGDLNYFNKAGAVFDLSGEPTLDELCSLPVEKVWYQLGVWLGVEDIILSQGKRYWPSD